MSILIKGMEMPKSCYVCRFCDGTAETEIGVCAYCCVDGGYREAYASNDCPLVPVPPHGDLIERDEAVRDLRMDYAYAAARIVSLQPVIIPAEEEER